MTWDTALVALHLGLLCFRGLLEPLSVTSEAIPEAEFLMHLDHLGVLTVANIAAQGLAARRKNRCSDQQCEKD